MISFDDSEDEDETDEDGDSEDSGDLEDGDDEHEVHFSDLSDGMQKKIKDALQKRLDAVSDALTDYDEANMDTDIDNYRKAQDAFYDAQEKHGDGSSMMRLAKDLDMDVSDDKYDRLNYY